MTKVFVYGSLMKNMMNHMLLNKANFIGITKTPPGFDMLDLGAFPGVIKGTGCVLGELYEVDDDTFKRLDRLEGYSQNEPEEGLYNRIEIETELGKAYMYVYNNHYQRRNPIVVNGDWKTHFIKRFNK